MEEEDSDGSPFFKILLFLCAILLFLQVWKSVPKESFTLPESFELKNNEDVYDNFYVGIYDSLVYSLKKNKFEINSILNATKLSKSSTVLDVGCGTGHHAAQLAESVQKVYAIDISPEMISKCIRNYPSIENVVFKQGNALDPYLFNYNMFDTVLCLYFTIYYMKNKRLFFQNCNNWLKTGGFLVVHLVDRDRFDPVVPPASPFLYVNPQSVAKERITKSSVVFNDFRYQADFVYKKDDDVSIFTETFTNGVGKPFRKNEHVFHMETDEHICKLAAQEGFKVKHKIDLLKASYEYQYLYVLQKL